MGNWSSLGKPKEVENKRPSIFKDDVVPLGTLFLAILSLFTQNTPPWWVSLAIAVFVGIVFLFLVVPALVRYWMKWRAWSVRVNMENNFLPKVNAALSRMKPMIEMNRSDTISGVWSDAAKTSEMQKYIRPNISHFYTLSAWLAHLSKIIDSAKPADFEFIAAETSSWIQQYISFCRDAYTQFEGAVQSKEFEDSKVREIKKNWNHARDEHNLAINNWKALCEEVNASFGRKICADYCETLKTLE
ncbi:MAG TPA: hypothetical protein VIY48_20640 [Candidatus Paceibacterota bacterium]